MVDLATTKKQFLNVTEVMEILGVCRRTMTNWVSQGELETVVIRGTLRFPVDALRKRLASRPSRPQVSGKSEQSHAPSA